MDQFTNEQLENTSVDGRDWRAKVRHGNAECGPLEMQTLRAGPRKEGGKPATGFWHISRSRRVAVGLSFAREATKRLC